MRTGPRRGTGRKGIQLKFHSRGMEFSRSAEAKRAVVEEEAEVEVLINVEPEEPEQEEPEQEEPEEPEELEDVN